MKKIRIGKSTDTLSKILESKIINNNESWSRWALDSIVDFFNVFKIKKTSRLAESDGLLFEYGIYDWDRIDNTSHFSMSFTRQIKLRGEDEFYQIRLKLLFTPEEFKELESFNLWSFEFESISEWKKQIENELGFIKALKNEITNHEITLDIT